MPQNPGRVKKLAVFLAAGLMLTACGRSGDEAEIAAAPVRHMSDVLAKSPHWKSGRCLCAGVFHGDEVEDFPAAMLQEAFAAHPFLRNWSECASLYGTKKSLQQCKGGMVDYICSTAERKDLPRGTTRVLCHVNGKNELLFDEYNVTRQDGGLTVTPISVKALKKVQEQDDADKELGKVLLQKR